MNDNECFNWYMARYLHLANHNPARIRNIDEILADELDYEDTKYPDNIKDIHTIQKNK